MNFCVLYDFARASVHTRTMEMMDTVQVILLLKSFQPNFYTSMRLIKHHTQKYLLKMVKFFFWELLFGKWLSGSFSDVGVFSVF